MSLDLLLEIGTEDLPARYMLPLADALSDSLAQGLDRRGIAHGAMARLATPRRLAVIIADVAETQSEQVIERSGPALKAALKEGQPTPAALGFARSCGVAFSELGERDGKLFFSRTEPGATTASLLQGLLDEALKQMDTLVPKRMRWGSGDDTFVRPVQWLCCLMGETVVPLQAFGLTADRQTFGHRFHAPAAIPLRQPAEYLDALHDARVMADVDTRKSRIRSQIEAEAQRIGGHARITESLLDEVTALVEWPVAITGHFEDAYLQLPPEVIVATVETNQRYFTVFSDPQQTRLTNAFITVANIESRDVQQVITGNERVVRPRLSDALFFYQQDLKQPLEAYAQQLAAVTFQQSLGSVADKAHRIQGLAAEIAAQLTDDSRALADVARAAQLSKCDLVTKMVFEFPELQGLMGGYYATAGGEPADVAQAVREHYLPTQQGTPIPRTLGGQAVALADKLDSLAGIFAIGQKPTASKDPFALRRAALGVLRICIEGQRPLDLAPLLRQAVAAQPAGDRDEATVDALLTFVLERLRAYRVGQVREDRAITAEAFEAVRALGVTQPLDFDARLNAVHHFAALPAAANLAAAHKRVRNLLRQAEAVSDTVDPKRFDNTAEHALWTTLTALEERNAALDDYTAQLVNLATLREPVDAFFEAVMVNADDAAVRANRLNLLARLDRLCRSVADISLLP